jgi:uncharacterized protein (DUF2147 family)
MDHRPLGLITAALFAGVIGAPAISSAQVSQMSRPEKAMPLATRLPADAILGEWCTQTEEKRPPARVRFERAPDGTYVGILSWASTARKDVHNKDAKLRDRSVVGIVLLWNLRYEDGEYVGGYVYNPEDGGTYRVKTEMTSAELLKVRGYLGISLFGETKTWTRYHAS